MNFSEKIILMHGEAGTYCGNIPINNRLGIPAMKMHDGPQGFRSMTHSGGPGIIPMLLN